MYFSNSKTSEPALRDVEVRLLGTGAAVPTKVYGQGITVTRTGVGDYLLTFAEHLGTYAGHIGAGIEATTAANVKNHSVVLGAYSTSARTLQVTFWDAAAAAHDLAALEWINLRLRFKQSA